MRKRKFRQIALPPSDGLPQLAPIPYQPTDQTSTLDQISIAALQEFFKLLDRWDQEERQL